MSVSTSLRRKRRRERKAARAKWATRITLAVIFIGLHVWLGDYFWSWWIENDRVIDLEKFSR